ncbi:MAG TPA: glycosyltransferase family 2 protein, partial [Phormidium sp.]
PPLELTDLHYYMLRWSDAWTVTSLNRLREKWNLTEDGYFKTKYKGLGWRRRDTIIRPISRRLTFGIKSHLVEKLLVPVDKVINRYLTDRYAQKQSQLMQQQTPLQLPKTPTTALSSN